MLSTTLPREAAGIKQQYGPDSIGVIVSSKATNEDGFNAEVRTHRHLLQRLFGDNRPNARNIKGAHFAVGCGYSYHHLPKGAPL
jgi:hypothetical protein